MASNNPATGTRAWVEESVIGRPKMPGRSFWPMLTESTPFAPKAVAHIALDCCCNSTWSEPIVIYSIRLNNRCARAAWKEFSRFFTDWSAGVAPAESQIPELPDGDLNSEP